MASVFVSDEVKEVAVTAMSQYGEKPLVKAAEKKDEDAVKALLAAGYTDLEERDGEWDNTALINAADNGAEGCLRLLLAAGADKDAVDKYGETGLILASKFGREGCVEILLAAGADKDVRATGGTDAGKTALEVAKTEAIKALLTK